MHVATKIPNKKIKTNKNGGRTDTKFLILQQIVRFWRSHLLKEGSAANNGIYWPLDVGSVYSNVLLGIVIAL